jgi:hypothetical protein
MPDGDVGAYPVMTARLNLLAIVATGLLTGALVVDAFLVSVWCLAGAVVTVGLMLFNLHCRAVWKATGEWP